MVAGKTALVTGGAGFIGSHLVDRLVDEGHKVIVVDDLSSGKLKNLNPAATFHHTDINHPSLQDIFHREEPDLVFHLAAQISVANSTHDPVHDAEINVIGALRVMEAARHHGVEKIIYSSTGGALYGDPEINPCSEQTSIEPLSPYGLSKYLAEQYLALYHRLYHMNYTILRYGNVYGPRQDPHGEAGVIAIFSQMMLEGKQPHIFGDGEQARDFVFVGDVVAANIAAIEKGDSDHFNIGTGANVDINRIYQLLRDIIQYRWDAEHRPARPGEVNKISLECSKAQQEFGWTPQVSIEEGLERTVDFFRGAARNTA